MSGVDMDAQRPVARVDPARRDLSRPEFEYFLAYTGLDEPWARLEKRLARQDRPALARLRLIRAGHWISLAAFEDIWPDLCRFARKDISAVDVHWQEVARDLLADGEGVSASTAAERPS